MALSFCSNWEPMDSPGQFYDPQSELDDALIGLYDPIDVPLDSLFDPPVDNPLHFAEPAVSSSLLPSFSDPSIISLLTEQYPLINDDFDFCRCPKRPRSCSDLYQPLELMFEPGAPSVSPAMVTGGWPSLEFAVPPPPLTAGMCNGEKKASGGEGLSAQSVAARERRKRISEKTQELGRLIPGGNKMNTAEMFQAAFKYVKFLQAQVGILGLMDSMQDAPSSSVAAENLTLLLKSQNLQEKLSSGEKCIVPKEMVDALAKDIDIRSSPFISRDLNRFMGSMENK